MVLTSLLASFSLGAFAPYGPAAFEEAARSGRPVLLVVGDVSSREEGAALADLDLEPLLRDRYVLVQADGLDRPDVADLATLALTALDVPEGGAGSTLLLLTPSGKPFAARRGAAPSDALREFLQRGHADFRTARASVEERAGRVVAALRRAQQGTGVPGPLAESLVTAVAKRLFESKSSELGGAARLFLLAHHTRTGDVGALARADRTTEAMPAGLAEGALEVEADARAARAQGSAARRAAALAAVARLANTLPPEGDLPPGIAADVGVVLQALAGAAQVLEAPELLPPAQRLAAAALARLGPFTALRHRAAHEGPATLDDHAHLALGLLALDAAAGESRWRPEVVRLVDAALGRFGDPEGGAFFATAMPTEPPGLRTRSAFDGRLPSGNGTFVRVLLRLSHLTGEARHRHLARRTLEWLAPALAEAPSGLETVALALDEYLDGVERPASPVGPLRSPPPAPPDAGPVRASAVLSRNTFRPGETVSAQVRLEMPEGWSVVAPEGRRPLFGLTLSVPGALVPVGRPVYPTAGEVPASGAAPAFPALFSGASIEVPLRVPLDLPPGPGRLVLRLRYQPCQGPHCREPDGATLTVPFTVLPASR